MIEHEQPTTPESGKSDITSKSGIHGLLELIGVFDLIPLLGKIKPNSRISFRASETS